MDHPVCKVNQRRKEGSADLHAERAFMSEQKTVENKVPRVLRQADTR